MNILDRKRSYLTAVINIKAKSISSLKWKIEPGGCVILNPSEVRMFLNYLNKDDLKYLAFVEVDKA